LVIILIFNAFVFISVFFIAFNTDISNWVKPNVNRPNEPEETQLNFTLKVKN